MQKLLSMSRSHLFIFVFIAVILGDGAKKKDVSVIYVREYSVCFPLGVLVSGLTFRSLIYLKLIFFFCKELNNDLFSSKQQCLKMWLQMI